MAVTNTGIVLRTIVGVNESDLFLDESTSVATNTGIVERSIVGVHDANFVHPIGDEEVSNGSFDTDLSDWTVGAGWSASGGKAVFDGLGFSPIRTNAGLVTGKTYKVTFDLDITSGNVIVQLGGATNTFDTSATHTFYDTATANIGFDSFVSLYSSQASNFSIDNVSVKEMLVNRESTTTNTGIVERPITGVNDGGDLFLDESTSVVNNTGIVERPITGVNESDALFPDNTESTVVNISDTIIPLLTALEARATTFENRECTQNILINLQKC